LADIAIVDPLTATENPDHSYAWRFAIHNSVADMGNNSWFAGADIAAENQSFPDGAHASYAGIGGGIRYFYNRTYGFEVGVQHATTWDYTTSVVAGSKKFSASAPTTYSLALLWVPAMNINVALNYAPSKGVYLDPANRLGTGESWSLIVDYGF
jgi:hypothetical protein